MSRAPFVAVRTDIRKEERVGFIADFAGYNEDEAVGKLVRLWCWCADRKLEDAPDDCPGYAVPEAVVRRFLGPRGVEAILGDGCDELAMGERRSDGLIYLRGTADTVDRLRSLRTSSVAGGLAQAANGKRSAKGRFVSLDTEVQPCSSSRTPATSSEIPDPRSQIQIPERDPEITRGIAARAGRKSARSAGPACTPIEAASVERVLARLAAASGVAYRGSDAHVRLIVNQLRAGVRESELRAVVAWCAEQWEAKPEMQQYLRPETLFGPQTIARYLDPARTRYAAEIAKTDRELAVQPSLEVCR